MKKILAIAIALFFIIGACSHASSIDWSSMSDKEIIFEIGAAQAELNRRKNTNDANATQIDSVIVDNGTITAYFSGFDDEHDLGVFYVKLRVKNKTNKHVWVYMDNASVNDETMQMVMNGVPFNILPNQSGTSWFIFSYGQLSFDSFSKVNTVSFKLCVEDKETYQRISTSELITLIK